eukprot:1410251-Pleurochrysis_carterae.AAC.1
MRSAVQHDAGMGAAWVRSPAASASRLTACSWSGWLNRSASPFASRGIDTASHCAVVSRAPASSTRICAFGLVAESNAAAA